MQTKSERLEMRMSAEHKQLLERAATLSGQPLTAFARSLLLGGAQAIVERHARTVLSRSDQERFLQVLASDKEPVPALKAAVRRSRGGRG